MTDFEKLGLFYLGRRHDPATGTTLDEPILYDSRDLVTHAVCVGMTGSGKTGLCVGLIEEAAIDGVPVIAIDPKGDLGNLLLTFPRLSASEFRPWIDEDDARRAGLSADAFAAHQADTWSKGMGAWGQDASRIERLRSAAEFSIFTPGSRAGLPVSILSSFAAPPPSQREDAEALAERASGTATSALVLAGAEGTPRSREHTLVASLLANAWLEGRDLDLAGLIRQVQTPPFDRVGVVDLESFYPARERFALAMRLNGVLAAPGFEAWLEGEPLDPQSLLFTDAGRPRVSIFSIAHLGDAERMFFVSLLLNQVVAWMRRQTGTTSLRAIVYMDEILGYFPPVANPPSKAPLLTLLKQGRAFGTGVLLATQNPVDLDYKGLGNTGTWFIGRLQTERDKARVLEGLDSVAGGLDRAEADRILSSLRKRIFLMHNVHEGAPAVFETRWTLSYLRGPLSREQIRLLTPQEQPARVPPPSPRAIPAASLGAPDAGAERPIVPPGVQEFFVPARGREARAVYRPRIIGSARLTFSDRSLGLSTTADVLYVTGVDEGAVEVDWTDGVRLDITARDLQREPAHGATFTPLPPPATQPRRYAAWEKAFSRWLAQNEGIELLRHTTLGLASTPGESERDFRIRLQLAARTARDAAMDAVRKKYATKQAALAARLARAEQAVDREQQQATGQKLQTAVSFGATLLGAMFGRKTASLGNLGRATTTARGVGRSMKEASDVKRAVETVASVKAAVAALEEQIAADVDAATGRYEEEAPLERVRVPPARGGVDVQFVGLAWIPLTSPDEGAPSS
ncbi:ATP-binding protein [soil metagenome]